LNEFVVNAYKHAFKTQQNGLISVTLRQRNEDDVVILTVRDNGPGLYNDFLTDGLKTLGFTLIDTLVHQLSGNLQTYNDQGAVFEVEFTPEEVV
jgi:two-component sensor histidine kinase